MLTSDQKKNIYVKKVGTRGNISIWIVDGFYIRNNIEREFTNFSLNAQFKIIPEKEIWLDKENHPDERRFYIDNALTMYKLCKENTPYLKALEIGSMVEQSERLRAQGNSQNKEFDLNKIHIKLWAATKSGYEIWIVDGNYVRTNCYIYYTEGGHHRVYNFVPTKEIWLDNDLSAKERSFVLLHELFEYLKMGQGLTYHQAHRMASKIEWDARHKKVDINKELANLGFILE